MSSHFLGNSYLFNDVYLQTTGSTCGPIEAKGPLKDQFDENFLDYYCQEKSFEKGERKMLERALNHCLNKANYSMRDIDVYIGSDMLNQNISIHYLARQLYQPVIGIYGACSSYALSMILSALLIEGGFVDKAMAMVVSSNATAERQYRYPIEYGVQKKITSTFTSTGAVCSLLTRQKTRIKVESMTLSRVIDYQQNNPNDMPRAMVPAAYDTLLQHFKDLNRQFDDYDLIVTGDLSHYGSDVLRSMLQKKGYDTVRYDDCGCLLYDEKQDVFQGGSGCVCSALVSVGYLIPRLLSGQYHRVLILSTGALLSPMMTFQKETIPCCAHALSLEVVE